MEQFHIEVTGTEPARMDVAVVETKTGARVEICDLPWNGSMTLQVLRIYLRMRGRLDDIQALNEFMGYEEVRK